MIVEEESNEGKGGDVKGQGKLEGVILEDSRMWVDGEDEEDDGVDDLVWVDLLEELALARLAIEGKAQPDDFPRRKKHPRLEKAALSLNVHCQHVAVDLNTAGNFESSLRCNMGLCQHGVTDYLSYFTGTFSTEAV
jgi:hypothetical protein